MSLAGAGARLLTCEHLVVVPQQRLQAAALPLQPPQGLPVQLARDLRQGKACY